MTARVDRDPERVPGAPPGYRPIDNMLGSCDRCGAAVSVDDPQAKKDHERFHQGLRAMWATAQAKSPPTRTEPDAPPTEADRSRVGGSNQRKPERGVGSGSDAASAPPDGPPPPGRASGGTNRSRPAGPGKPMAGREPTDDPWYGDR